VSKDVLKDVGDVGDVFDVAARVCDRDVWNKSTNILEDAKDVFDVATREGGFRMSPILVDLVCDPESPQAHLGQLRFWMRRRFPGIPETIPSNRQASGWKTRRGLPRPVRPSCCTR
jgi:hypothetical protein